MVEKVTKAEFLSRIETGYQQFETLLASISEKQMTTHDVNGPWSVKDNISHIAVWQDFLQSTLQAYQDGQPLPEFLPGITSEDEENEFIFQKNKDRPLAEVLSSFRASYQRTLATIQSFSEEALNSTLPWKEGERPIWQFVVGDTFGHYQEHGDIIRDWLVQQSKK